jgi:hypothetical protein
MRTLSTCYPPEGHPRIVFRCLPGGSNRSSTIHPSTPTRDERLIRSTHALWMVSKRTIVWYNVWRQIPDRTFPAITAISWPLSGLDSPCIKPPPDCNGPVRFRGLGTGPENKVPAFKVSTPSCCYATISKSKSIHAIRRSLPVGWRGRQFLLWQATPDPDWHQD